MKDAFQGRGGPARLIVLVAALFLAGGVAAQSPTPAAKPAAPAKSTKPAKARDAGFQLCWSPRQWTC